MDDINRLVIVYSPKSTRARRYTKVRADLQRQADIKSWTINEIEITDLPYYQAVKKIATKIRDGDLVLAAGGDGIAQTTFQAIYTSKSSCIFTAVPLGNANDISRAINGRYRSAELILRQPVTDFYPLNVVIDGGIAISLISYVTFGATTVLVDYLNRDNMRHRRRLLKNLSPAMSISAKDFNQISRQISDLNFPDFIRGGCTFTDDSIGFFLIPAAHNILRLPKNIALAKSEFFFHHATTKDKNLIKKIVMAGAWTIKFPGEMTELEELKFANNDQNIIANISGDNVDLGKIKQLSAIRSTRPVRILSSTPTPS